MDDVTTFVCWKWTRAGSESSYTSAHVNALHHMVRANYDGRFRFLCITDDSAGLTPGIEVMELPSRCRELIDTWGLRYCKLYVFSEAFARQVSARIVHLDLDVVITGKLNSLIDDDPTFRIIRRDYPWHKKVAAWAKGRSKGKKVFFNSSFYVLKPGSFCDVWDSFDPEVAWRTAERDGLVGSDQAWLTHKLLDTAETVGTAQGLYRHSELKNHGTSLPRNCRLVYFPGHKEKKPWHPEILSRFPWIRDFAPFEDSERAA